MAQIQFHQAFFRTHAHATEDRERVRKALLFAMGADAPIEEARLEGHHGNPILQMSATVGQTARVRRLFERLAEDPATLATLERQLDARMADDGTVYLRLSKQEAFQERLALAFDDDAIHVRAKVATYPSRGDVARGKLREYLAKLKEKQQRPAADGTPTE